MRNDPALYCEEADSRPILHRPLLLNDGVKMDTLITDKTGTLTTKEKQTVGTMIDVGESGIPKYKYLSVEELRAHI